MEGLWMEMGEGTVSHIPVLLARNECVITNYQTSAVNKIDEGFKRVLKKSESDEKHPSGAEAPFILLALCGG
jgi:hypothetical protein